MLAWLCVKSFLSIVNVNYRCAAPISEITTFSLSQASTKACFRCRGEKTEAKPKSKTDGHKKVGKPLMELPNSLLSLLYRFKTWLSRHVGKVLMMTMPSDSSRVCASACEAKTMGITAQSKATIALETCNCRYVLYNQHCHIVLSECKVS